MANTLTSNLNRKYFRFLWKSNRRYIFLYGFALLITFPVFVLSLSPTVPRVDSLYYIGKTLNVIIALAGTVIIPLLLFQFTTSRRSIDVFHALPIQKEYLFMINYFGGITMLLVPYLISTFTGFLICAFFGMDEIAPLLELQNFTLVSLALLVSYSITLFAKKNCGTVFDAFLYTIALHLIPVMAYVTYYWFCSEVLLGFNETFSNNIFYYLTPIPAMFIYALRTTDELWLSIPGSAFVFYGICVIVFYFICSYLFVNHKSERTNMPFVNGYFYPIVSFISTVIAITLLHTFMYVAFEYDGISAYVFPLLVGAVFYLILDVIANRGFKKLTSTLIRYGMISAVVLALIVPVKSTNGFGYVTRIPDPEDIDEVTIRLDYYLSSMLGFSDYNSYVTFKDPEEIKVIHDIHQGILDQYALVGYNKNDFYSKLMSPTYNGFGASLFTLEYDLGLTAMRRQYYVTQEWMIDLVKLAASDAMIDGRYPAVSHSEDYLFTDIWLSDRFQTSNNVLYNTLYRIDWNINDLMDAVEADLKKETLQEYLDSPYDVIGYLGITANPKSNLTRSANYLVPIKSSYANTMKFLENNKYDMPDPDLKYWEDGKFALVYPNSNDLDFIFQWYQESDLFTKFSTSGFSYRSVTFEEAKQLTALIHHSVKTEQPNLLLFVLDSNGMLKYYPIRYRDLDAVNAIVKGELQYESNNIYDVLYYKD